MPASPREPSASVIELASFRRSQSWAVARQRRPAELLSLRRSLSYAASVEIDKLETLSQELDARSIDALKRHVRNLLDREFGRLRVHRDNRHFVARHRSVDALIAGLLRVQFHALQYRLPACNKHGEPMAPQHLSVTWGVGQSGHEARLERLRRRGRS